VVATFEAATDVDVGDCGKDCCSGSDDGGDGARGNSVVATTPLTVSLHRDGLSLFSPSLISTITGGICTDNEGIVPRLLEVEADGVDPFGCAPAALLAFAPPDSANSTEEFDDSLTLPAPYSDVTPTSGPAARLFRVVAVLVDAEVAAAVAAIAN
jgi:hypothetical protein